jgi:large subunit ribosomal protein L18
MVNKKPKTILYRRKRELKTDYNKRLKLLTSMKPRLVVRFSNKKIIGQIVEFLPKGDIVKVGISSDSIKKQGWNIATANLPVAYLTGLSLGNKAVGAGIEEVILDTGLRRPIHKGKIYAFLKGVIDSGLEVPHGKGDIFPNEERISGQHLKNDAKELFIKVKQSISTK